MSDAMQPQPNASLGKASMILGIAGIGVFVISFILIIMGASSMNLGLIATGGLLIYLSILLGIIGLILGIIFANQGGAKGGLIINAVLLGIILILWVTGMAGG